MLTEDQTIVLVCTSVEAGSTAGRTIIIDYQTTDGSAKGIKLDNQRYILKFMHFSQLQVTIYLSMETLT